MEPGQGEQESPLATQFQAFAEKLPDLVKGSIVPDLLFAIQRPQSKDQQDDDNIDIPQKEETNKKDYYDQYRLWSRTREYVNYKIPESPTKSIINYLESIYQNLEENHVGKFFNPEDKTYLKNFTKLGRLEDFMAQQTKKSPEDDETEKEKPKKVQYKRTYFVSGGEADDFTPMAEARIAGRNVIMAKIGRNTPATITHDEREMLEINQFGDKFSDDYSISYVISNPHGQQNPDQKTVQLYSLHFNKEGDISNFYFPHISLLQTPGSDNLQNLEAWAESNTEIKKDGVRVRISNAHPTQDGRKRVRIDIIDPTKGGDLGNYTIVMPLTGNNFDIVNSVGFKSLVENPTQSPKDKNPGEAGDLWRDVNFADLIGFEVYSTGIQSDPRGSDIQQIGDEVADASPEDE